MLSPHESKYDHAYFRVDEEIPVVAALEAVVCGVGSAGVEAVSHVYTVTGQRGVTLYQSDHVVEVNVCHVIPLAGEIICGVRKLIKVHYTECPQNLARL